MSKVRDISNLSNIIKTDASGNVSFVSGSTTLATLNTSGQLSGSSPVLSSSYASTSSYATNFNVSGTITATTLVVQTVTSSVIYSSGSNIFGNSLANTQTFTGSVSITGSALNVNNGGLFVSSSGYVGINTTNPTSPLTVKAGSRSDTLRLSISGSSSVSDAVGITFGSATYDKAQIIAYNENTGNAAGYLTFWTGGSPNTTDITERIRITSQGDVGIGTTSPGSKLEVRGYIGMTAATGSGNQFNIYSNNQSNNNITLAQGWSTGIDNVGYLYNRANADFVFGTNNTERMRISAAGTLTVAANGVATISLGASANYVNISSGGGGATIYMNGATRGGSGTAASGAVVIATDNVFYLTDSTTNTAKITALANGNVGIGISPASGIKLDVYGNMALNDQAFRWRSGTDANHVTQIDGTTNGPFTYGYSGAALGYQAIRVIWTNTTNAYNYNNSTTWQQTSDIRIKQNIRPISNVLNKIVALNPTHFEFKTKPGITQTGFIAQEFEQVFPGHVTELENLGEYAEYFEEGEKIKSIDADLIPYLVKAIQEQQAQINELKAQING